jgi:hypothetical protein
MNVVANGARLEQGAFVVFNDTADVGVKLIPKMSSSRCSRFFVENTRCTRIRASD